MISQTQKSNAGRPSKMSEVTIRKLEMALWHGYTITTACIIAGISRETYYAHIDKNPELSDRFELAQQMVSYKARNVILQAIANNDVKVSMWWLERQCRSEFAPPKQSY